METNKKYYAYAYNEKQANTPPAVGMSKRMVQAVQNAEGVFYIDANNFYNAGGAWYKLDNTDASKIYKHSSFSNAYLLADVSTNATPVFIDGYKKISNQENEIKLDRLGIPTAGGASFLFNLRLMSPVSHSWARVLWIGRQVSGFANFDEPFIRIESPDMNSEVIVSVGRYAYEVKIIRLPFSYSDLLEPSGRYAGGFCLIIVIRPQGNQLYMDLYLNFIKVSSTILSYNLAGITGPATSFEYMGTKGNRPSDRVAWDFGAIGAFRKALTDQEVETIGKAITANRKLSTKLTELARAHEIAYT